jgi:hypothetical protein
MFTADNCFVDGNHNFLRNTMSGKAKSIYLSIQPKGQYVNVFKRVFFDAKSYNEYVKTDEFKNKWPKEEFDIVKEVY